MNRLQVIKNDLRDAIYIVSQIEKKKDCTYAQMSNIEELIARVYCNILSAKADVMADFYNDTLINKILKRNGFNIKKEINPDRV